MILSELNFITTIKPIKITLIVNNSSTTTPPALGLLENPAIGNVFLLLASIIGIAGSFILYEKRKSDNRAKLKRALAFEIREMDLEETVDTLESINDPPPQTRLNEAQIPPADALPTTVYESNTGDLGLLDESEIDEVVDFYTTIIKYKSVIRAIREDPDEAPMPDHETLVNQISDISERQDELLGLLGYAQNPEN
jgi:hypothetical protein